MDSTIMVMQGSWVTKNMNTTFEGKPKSIKNYFALLLHKSKDKYSIVAQDELVICHKLFWFFLSVAEWSFCNKDSSSIYEPRAKCHGADFVRCICDRSWVEIIWNSELHKVSAKKIPKQVTEKHRSSQSHWSS